MKFGFCWPQNNRDYTAKLHVAKHTSIDSTLARQRVFRLFKFARHSFRSRRFFFELHLWDSRQQHLIVVGWIFSWFATLPSLNANIYSSIAQYSENHRVSMSYASELHRIPLNIHFVCLFRLMKKNILSIESDNKIIRHGYQHYFGISASW